MKLVKYNYRQIVDEIIENLDLSDSTCLDATCGRGKDSLKILKQIKSGYLYACDIQEEAIKSTKELLNKNNYSNYSLMKVSHEKVFDYIDSKLNLIVYNLGYLPNSDKKIVTKPSTTLASLKRALEFLKVDGIIIVVSYLGHKGSYEERHELEIFLKSLNQKKYLVEKREFFNQDNNPPVVYLIGVRK